MRRSNLARKPNGAVKTASFPLKGGLNIVDSPMSISKGMVLSAVNYELLTKNGYRRIQGHERFDGQASPSEASYWILNYDTGATIEPAVDTTVTGATSGATGKIGLVVVTTGTWAGGDAVGYLVLFNVSGNFTDTESLLFNAAGDGFDSGFSAGFG